MTSAKNAEKPTGKWATLAWPLMTEKERNEYVLHTKSFDQATEFNRDVFSTEWFMHYMRFVLRNVKESHE